MAEALAEAGYVVSLVAPTRRPHVVSTVTPPGVSLRSFRMPAPARSRAGQLREQAQAMAGAGRALASVARTSPVHIVQVGNPPDNGWLFPYLLGLVQGFVPAFVYDQHDPAPLLVRAKFGRGVLTSLIERVLMGLEAMAFRRADLVVLANKPYLQRATALGLLRSGALVAPNGWSLRTTPTKAPLPWRHSDVPLLAYVGMTNAQDCITHLVEAVACVRVPLQVVVAGDGDARRDAEQLAHRLGVADRIVWLGWVTDRGLVARLVAEADICAAPETSSPANDITSFVKVIEYMSLGAPIVAHRLPQTELIAGDAVEYADDESPAAFAAAVERVLVDREGVAWRREAARRRFDEALRWESVGAPRLVEGYASAFLSDSGPVSQSSQPH